MELQYYYYYHRPSSLVFLTFEFDGTSIAYDMIHDIIL